MKKNKLILFLFIGFSVVQLFSSETAVVTVVMKNQRKQPALAYGSNRSGDVEKRKYRKNKRIKKQRERVIQKMRDKKYLSLYQIEDQEDLDRGEAIVSTVKKDVHCVPLEEVVIEPSSFENFKLDGDYECVNCGQCDSLDNNYNCSDCKQWVTPIKDYNEDSNYLEC